jgi:hypothetical protein
MLDPHQMKVKSLQRQLEFLEMLQQRHLNWASGTDHIDAKSKHLDILDTLRTLVDQYEAILMIYSKEIE